MTATCPNHPDRPSAIESGYGFCHECRQSNRPLTVREAEAMFAAIDEAKAKR